MKNNIDKKTDQYLQDSKEARFYLIDKTIEDLSSDLILIINKLTQIIPRAFDSPTSLKLKIILNNLIVSNDTFNDEDTQLSAHLSDNTKTIGEIKIYYSISPNLEIRNFTPEEIQTFNIIVNKLNDFLSLRKIHETYSTAKSKKNTEKNKIQNNSQDETEFNKFLQSLSLPETEIENITKVHVNFKKNETICKQGSFASFIMILRKGFVKAFIETSHYKNHIFKISSPFNIIGLSSLYGDNYYHFSCSALTDSSIYLVERSNFDRIIRTYPEFSILIMQMYSNSLQNVYNKLGSIANKQSVGKVCDSLLYLSSKVFESNIIDTRVSRKDIAELSGLSAENLVRVLSDLKRDNIIDIKNRNIEILKFSSLEMLRNLG